MMYEQKIIENLREFSAEYQYEDQKLSETCFRAADAIEELQKPKWISVEERLPEFDGRVLCWRKGVHHRGVEYMDILYFNLDLRRFDNYGWIDKDIVVTHWMPLPELPKEDTDA